MFELYLEHTMIAACKGADIVSDPSALLMALSLATAVIAVPLFFGFRFLGNDVNIGQKMLGKATNDQTPFLLGLSRGGFVGYICLVLGLPVFGGGLYPVPDFVFQDPDIACRIHGAVFFLFVLVTVLLDLHLDGKLRMKR